MKGFCLLTCLFELSIVSAVQIFRMLPVLPVVWIQKFRVPHGTIWQEKIPVYCSKQEHRSLQYFFVRFCQGDRFAVRQVQDYREDQTETDDEKTGSFVLHYRFPSRSGFVLHPLPKTTRHFYRVEAVSALHGKDRF